MDATHPSARDLLAAIPHPAVLLDATPRVVDVNDAFVREWAAFDATREDLVGRLVEKLEGPLDETLVHHLTALPAANPVVLSGISLWRPEEEERTQADLHSRPVGADGVRLVIIEPSGEASRWRQEAHRVRRMAVLGALAAGVAHDLNNQLSATLNMAELLREEMGGAASAHAGALDIIEGSASEAAELSKRLLALAGRGEPEIQRIRAADLVERATMLVRHEMPPKERFAIAVDPLVGEVRGDPGQLQYLVVMLALSAASALRESGRGSLAVREIEASAGIALGARTLPPGRYLEMTLACTGDVDPSDSLELAAQIAADHGGGLEWSGTGDGLKARVLLPAAAQEAAAADPGRGGGGAPPARTVLVVDDDAMVRDVTLAMVRRLGYAALGAESGRAALDLLEQPDTEVDLVILDLVLPDMDGSAVLRRIRVLRPRVRVVVSSGYASAVSMEMADGTGADGLLEKPYSLAALRGVLEQMLA